MQIKATVLTYILDGRTSIQWRLWFSKNLQERTCFNFKWFTHSTSFLVLLGSVVTGSDFLQRTKHGERAGISHPSHNPFFRSLPPFHKLPATEQSTSLIRFSRRRIHSLPPLHSTRRTVALPSSFCLWDMQAQAKWVLLDRSPKSWLGYVYPASLSASKSTDLVSMSRISWIRSRVLVFLDPFFEIRQEAAQEMERK